MFAVFLLATVVLSLQCSGVVLPLNFSAVGLAWQMDSLYILYNSMTVDEKFIKNATDIILEEGKGYFAKVPYAIVDIKTSTLSLQELRGYSVKSVIVVIVNDFWDPVCAKTSIIMRNIKRAAAVFLVKHISEQVGITKAFNVLRQFQFKRVLLASLESQEMFSLESYPEVRVLNVTGKGELEYFPAIYEKDLKGYILNVPVQMDVPNIFWYFDLAQNRNILDGLGGKIFETFMKSLNVTLNVYPLYVNGSNLLDMDRIEQLIMKGEMEISPHLHTTFEYKDLAYSYPHMSTPRCLIIPMDYVPTIELIPFKWSTAVIFVTFLPILEIIGICVLRYGRSWCRLPEYWTYKYPGMIAFNAMCILIGFPLPNKKIFNKKNTTLVCFIRILCLYILVTFSGFCFSQINSSSMTSRLAASSTSRPYVTAKNIIDMDIKIMGTRRDAKYLSDIHDFGSKAVGKVYSSSYGEFHNNRLNLNTSFIYPMSMERWEIVQEQQLYLKYKRFWLSDVCYGHYPVQYQMRYDSIFLPYLNRYILHVLESGLYTVWRQEIVRSAVKQGYMKCLRDSPYSSYERKQKKFSKILRYIIIIFFSLGFGVCGSVFIGELLVAKYFKRTLVLKKDGRTKRKVEKFAENTPYTKKDTL